MSKFNIQRYTEDIVLDFSEDDNQIILADQPLNGLLRGVHFTVPELDSTNTADLTIKDADGNTIYSNTGVAQSSTATEFVDANNEPLQLPLSGEHDIQIDTSGAQTADRTFTVVLLIER